MFYNNIKNTKLPLKTAYKLNKLFIQINEELLFYQQKFTEIINEFGKRDENGELMYSSDKTSIEIMDGRRLECQQKIEELQNLEVNIEGIEFTTDELESLNLTISEVECLMPFIKESLTEYSSPVSESTKFFLPTNCNCLPLIVIDFFPLKNFSS